MKDSKRKDPSIQKLLEHLEQKPDNQVGVATLKGRAVSRSANNVHLAVAGGIVAVPIGNIEKVIPLSSSQIDAVAVVVRNPEEIQPLLRVRPGRPGGGAGGSGGGGTVDTARDGDTVLTDRTYKWYLGVGTCTTTDTDTISGGNGEPDQCDDTETDNCPADDTSG